MAAEAARPGFYPNLCASLIGGSAVELSDGTTLAQLWRRMSPVEREDWVKFAAELGVVPEGAVDYSMGLPPAMVLAPGGFCYRTLNGGEGQGAGGATAPEAGPETGDAFEYRPTSRGIVARVLDWLRDLLSRALQLAADALRSVIETIRSVIEAIAGAAGGVALWLALGLAVVTGLYLVTQDGGGRGRGR